MGAEGEVPVILRPQLENMNRGACLQLPPAWYEAAPQWGMPVRPLGTPTLQAWLPPAPSVERLRVPHFSSLLFL